MSGEVKWWAWLGAGRAPGPASFLPILLEAREGGVTYGTQGPSGLSGLLLRRRLGPEGTVTSHKTGRSRGSNCLGSRAATGALELREPMWREGSACHGCFLDVCLCGQSR